MKVDFMRKLDFWAGVPVCFLLSGADFFLKFLGRRRPRPIQKILFIKLSEMGAIIQAYSLLKRVRDLYPSAAIYFLTFEKNRGLFPLLKDILPPENVLTIREDSMAHFAVDTTRALSRMRALSLDIVFDLEMFSRFTAGLSYLSAAARRVGFYRYTLEGLYRGNLLTHRVVYNPLEHISKMYLSMCHGIAGAKKTDPALAEKIKDEDILLPSFVSRADAARQVRAALEASGVPAGERLFLINPGEGMLSLREWPIENFVGLAKMILETPRTRVLLVGTEELFPKARALCQAVKDPRCIDFSGRTTLGELLELFVMSDALIANDGGLAHLAALTGVKKFIIYGPESPRIFGPLSRESWFFYTGLPCSPCLSALNHRRSVCREAFCLSSVDVATVYRKITEVCSLGVSK